MPQAPADPVPVAAVPSLPTARPASADALLALARAHYADLSRQLKLIARHLESHRDRLGFDGVQETAARCGVQPSAVVRFAKRFGLSGFTEMQALFRHDAEQKLAANRDYQPDYPTRIRSFAARQPIDARRVPHEVIAANLASLQALGGTFDDARFEAAVTLMLAAPSLWLVAARRAFPVAAYLAYALQQTDKPIHWLNGLGHMQEGEMRAMRAGDVLVAVSFDPYASETQQVAQTALARGAKLVALTDSQFSPLAQDAAVTLLAADPAPYGFRSLTATLSLAQSLFISLACRMALPGPA